MVFRWSLRDRKSAQVSHTVFSIFTNLNNAAVWMISNRPPVSETSSPLSKALENFRRMPIRTGITESLCYRAFIVSWQGPRPGFRFRFFFGFSLKLLTAPGPSLDFVREGKFLYTAVFIGLIITRSGFLLVLFLTHLRVFFYASVS